MWMEIVISWYLLLAVLSDGEGCNNLLQSKNHCLDRSIAFSIRFRVQLSAQIYNDIPLAFNTYYCIPYIHTYIHTLLTYILKNRAKLYPTLPRRLTRWRPSPAIAQRAGCIHLRWPLFFQSCFEWRSLYPHNCSSLQPIKSKYAL